MALSSTEAEYMALTQGVKEALWLAPLLCDLGALSHGKQIRQLQSHNQGAIVLTNNALYHAWSKHIDIQIHLIR